MDTHAILTLQVSPSNSSTEDIIRKVSGSNPKNIMRLLNTEPVSKLYDYLQSKWKLAEDMDLILLCKGQRMELSSKLHVYSDGSLSGKLPIEYEIVPTADEFDSKPIEASDISPPSTAAQTPVSSPYPPPLLEVDETVEALPPPEKVVKPSKVQRSPKKPHSRRVRQSIPTAIVPTVPDDVIETASTLIPESTESMSKIEALYREMLDRERDMFLTVLESQAKWMTEMHNRTINACMAMSGAQVSDMELTDEPDLKRNRKTHK